MAGNILQRLRKELQSNVDKTVQRSAANFFKEPIKCYGIKTATAHAIAKQYFKELKSEPKETVFALCEDLLQSGYMEESFIANTWSYAVRKQYVPADFKTFQKWVNTYINNWASCDGLCSQTIGAFIMMYSQYATQLKKWTTSKNRWMRRAAAVSLVAPARKGLFADEALNIATLLLTDTDDLVQKGYGWLLKVVAAHHQQTVFDFVMMHKADMPRTALRYAIEKMPDDLRQQAMAK